MSDVDVAEIREALAKATPGPWSVDQALYDGYVIDGPNATSKSDRIFYEGQDGEGGCQRIEDAELIVLLRNNTEGLLDELETERTALNRASERVLALRADCDLHREGFKHDQADIKTLLQALWDVYSELGFDTDGDPTPGAQVAGMGIEGFGRMVVNAAAEHRRDCEIGYDQDLDDAERRGAVKTLRDFAEVVGQAGGDDKKLDAVTLERVRWTAIDTAEAIENVSHLYDDKD